jgi:histidinol phosphatase-like enzyme
MKVIFLDVDGVLNSEDDLKIRRENGKQRGMK